MEKNYEIRTIDGDFIITEFYKGEKIAQVSIEGGIAASAIGHFMVSREKTGCCGIVRFAIGVLKE